MAPVVVNESVLVRVTPGNLGNRPGGARVGGWSAGLDPSGAVAFALQDPMIQYIPVTFVGLLLTPSLASRGPGGSPAAAPNGHTE